MAAAGNAGPFKVGKRSLGSTGTALVFTTGGRCSECCTTYEVATFTEAGVTTSALARILFFGSERP